jgi:hypothetical protein
MVLIVFSSHCPEVDRHGSRSRRIFVPNLLTGSAEIVAPVSGTNVRFHRGVVVFPSTLHATLLDINAKALD